MPGIVAIIDTKFPHSAINRCLLRTMTCAVAHENWHKTDIYSRPPLYIGRVHLGITNAEPQLYSMRMNPSASLWMAKSLVTT